MSINDTRIKERDKGIIVFRNMVSLLKALLLSVIHVRTALCLYEDVKHGLYFYKDISGVIVLSCDTRGVCEYYNMVTGDFYRGSFLHILSLRSNGNACR